MAGTHVVEFGEQFRCPAQVGDAGEDPACGPLGVDVGSGEAFVVGRGHLVPVSEVLRLSSLGSDSNRTPNPCGRPSLNGPGDELEAGMGLSPREGPFLV